ncbi:integrase core domain-containing protein [Saccharopolyspora shandongensis]|uniref:integrase core domain-containing protein n=1 Tax=Saccharopolyspora shandongensis TaxID=418495 RepID=UPI0033F8B016
MPVTETSGSAEQVRCSPRTRSPTAWEGANQLVRTWTGRAPETTARQRDRPRGVPRAATRSRQRPPPRIPAGRLGFQHPQVIRTLRNEVCDHVLILNETHARQVLAEHQRHYNQHRPHQTRQQRPPEPRQQHQRAHRVNARPLLHTRVLNGLITSTGTRLDVQR